MISNQSIDRCQQDLEIDISGKNTDEIRHLVIKELEKLENTGWLLVFDNAEDLNLLKLHLPSRGGCVLITSRRSGIWSDTGGEEVRLEGEFQP